MQARSSTTPMGSSVAVLVILANLCVTLVSSQCEDPVTTVAQGILRGTVMTSRSGRKFCAFRGVPFAKPPVGNLRFRPPQPPDSWTGERNAMWDPNNCPQIGDYVILPFGSEDCLYLNVYTPKMKEDKLPVMAYIVGGGFYFGTISSYIYGPQFLMDKNVIVVLFNYRVGPLGFMTTGDDEMPGNLGMKDQVAALRWLKDNIAAFGGDPERVTLAGGSAGAVSVHYHLLSPMSRGLFQRAISQSGTALVPWGMPLAGRDPLVLTMKHAALVGCPINSTRSMAACLRRVNPAILNIIAFVFLARPPHRLVVEKSPATPNQGGCFLPDHPAELMRRGEFTRVPWIVGTNQDEGVYWAGISLRFPPLLYLYNKFRQLFEPLGMQLQLSVQENLLMDTWKKISQFYIGNTSSIIDNTVADNFTKMYGDRIVVHGSHMAMIYHIMAGHTPLYIYNLAYRGQYSIFFSLQYYGVSHGDELIYMFQIPFKSFWLPGHPDLEAVDTMVSLWTNFATYGVPTPPNSSLQGVEWQPVRPYRMGDQTVPVDYLEISGPTAHTTLFGDRAVRTQMKTDLFAQRMRFWDSLPLQESIMFRQMLAKHNLTYEAVLSDSRESKSIAPSSLELLTKPNPDRRLYERRSEWITRTSEVHEAAAQTGSVQTNSALSSSNIFMLTLVLFSLTRANEL